MKQNIRKIKKWWNNQSIRSRINMIYILLITSLLLVFTNIVSYISSQSLINNTISNSNDASKLVMMNVDNILSDTESYANDLTVRINNYFINDDFYNDSYQGNEILKKIFRNTLYVFPSIQGIMLILPDDRVFASDDIILYQNIDAIIDRYSTIKNDTIKGQWIATQKNEFITTDSDEYVLTLCKEIININTGEYVGLLVVLTGEDSFSDIYRDMGLKGSMGNYFICDNDGIIVSSSDNEEILKPVDNTVLREWIIDDDKTNQIIKIDGEKTLVTSFTFPKLNWKLIGTVPISNVTQESRNLIRLIIGVGSTCLILSIFLSNYLSQSITRPIGRLITEIKGQALENLSVPIPVDSKDDIGILTKNFNNMKMRIGELMKKVITQQEKQTRYEIRLLQAQLRPHFLYNTLQMIYSMVDMNKKREAKKAVKAVADFYRIVLSHGNDIISLDEEIQNVEAYLYIHKLRHTEMFNYSIDVPDKYRQLKILKLTLQPIVENCFKHGFKNAKPDFKGNISISAKENDDRLEIIVEDNGRGIKPEAVLHLLDGKAESSNKIAFGLKSIDEKIKLFYGIEYGLTIESLYQKGTLIHIFVPVIDDNIDEI